MENIPSGTPGVTDPNHTAWDVVDNTPYEPGNQGGKTKVNPTDMSGESGQPMHTSNDASMQEQGVAQGPTLPKAAPITPMIFGDPNNTAAGEPSK